MPARGGENGGEGGAVDAGQHAENHLGGGHGGAGVAGGEEAGGAAFADHLEADAHGGVALGADGLGGLVVHGDPLGGGNDEDRQALAAEVLAQDGTEDIFGAGKVDADVILTRSEDGPANLGFGGLVGAHSVYNDIDRHQQGTWSVRIRGMMLACFLDREDLAALVGAALAADAMGQLALMAVGALGEAGGGEEVVAAALGSPLLGVAPFWIRHCSIPFDRLRRPCADAAGDEAKT